MTERADSLLDKMPQKTDTEPGIVIEQYKVNARSGLCMRAGAGV